MSNESHQAFEAKKKLLIGRRLRTSLGPRIARVLGIPIEEIRFTNEPDTSAVDAAFGRGMISAEVHVLPNRQEAIQFVLSHCQQFFGPGFWLVEDFHLVGAVEVELPYVLQRLDSLLQEHGEFIRLMSHDGTKGLCISTEEGTADRLERHVVIWP